MKDARKVDLNAPRFRAKRFNTVSIDWIGEIRDHEDCLVKDENKIKKILVASNKMIAQAIIDFRDGIELPEQLGYLFLGTCQPKIRKNVDFKTTKSYLKVIQHRNWESDNYLAKIFYTNYETKYKFKFNDMWGFKACREFTTEVGRTYPENWKKYIQVDHTLKISKLYRKSKMEEQKELEHRIELQDYNPLDLD